MYALAELIDKARKDNGTPSYICNKMRTIKNHRNYLLHPNPELTDRLSVEEMEEVNKCWSILVEFYKRDSMRQLEKQFSN